MHFPVWTVTNGTAGEDVTIKLTVLNDSLQLVLGTVFGVFLAVRFCIHEFGFKRLIILYKCHKEDGGDNVMWMKVEKGFLQ